MKWQIEGPLLRLEGAITEATEFPTPGELPSPVQIDLSCVPRINSMGVKRWVDFLASFEVAPRLLRCSPPMVRQFNMVPTAVTGTVESVLVPWFCESCDEDHELLTTLDGEVPTLEPNPTCPDCSEPMELDEVKDAYFSFLER